MRADAPFAQQVHELIRADLERASSGPPSGEVVDFLVARAGWWLAAQWFVFLLAEAAIWLTITLLAMHLLRPAIDARVAFLAIGALVAMPSLAVGGFVRGRITMLWARRLGCRE